MDSEEQEDLSLKEDPEVEGATQHILFSHPLGELFWNSGIAYPKSYKEYLNYKRNEQVFMWCSCSGAYSVAPNPSRSKFLTELARDLERVQCNAVFKTFSYLKLPKPLYEYVKSEDKYVQDLKNHLDIPMQYRNSVYTLILEMDLEEEYHYLLMNYMDNMGYMEHGVGIRCGYKPS